MSIKKENLSINILEQEIKNVQDTIRIHNARIEQDLKDVELFREHIKMCLGRIADLTDAIRAIKQS